MKKRRYNIAYIALLEGFYDILQTSDNPFSSYCLQFTWLWLSGKKQEKDRSVRKTDFRTNFGQAASRGHWTKDYNINRCIFPLRRHPPSLLDSPTMTQSASNHPLPIVLFLREKSVCFQCLNVHPVGGKNYGEFCLDKKTHDRIIKATYHMAPKKSYLSHADMFAGTRVAFVLFHVEKFSDLWHFTRKTSHSELCQWVWERKKGLTGFSSA